MDVDELAATARLVVRGTVDSIGRPHFNSDNGGFWHSKLLGADKGRSIALGVFRDVTVRVSETWGCRDVPAVGRSLTFSAVGGQIQVELPRDAQRKLQLPPAERYVWTEEPGVDFAVGADLLFFLDVDGIDGLYGGRLGAMRAFLPALENAYVYRIDGETATNLAAPYLSAPVADLRAAVDRSLGKRAGKLPGPGFTPQEPHGD